MDFTSLVGEPIFNVLIYSGVISVVLFILNIFINNVVLDMVCGISYAITVSSFISILQGNTEPDGLFYLQVLIFFFAYLVLYTFIYRMFTKFAETSNTITRKDYDGKMGEVITTIPINGVGEVLITASLQKISMPARFYLDNTDTQPEAIKQGTKVLVIENKDGVIYVIPYIPMFSE